jgi:hypothetical protein
MGKKKRSNGTASRKRRPRIEVVRQGLNKIENQIEKLRLGDDVKLAKALAGLGAEISRLVEAGYVPPRKVSARVALSEGDAVKIAKKFEALYMKDIVGEACKIVSVAESGDKKKRHVLTLKVGSALVSNVPRSHVVLA